MTTSSTTPKPPNDQTTKRPNDQPPKPPNDQTTKRPNRCRSNSHLGVTRCQRRHRHTHQARCPWCRPRRLLTTTPGQLATEGLQPPNHQTTKPPNDQTCTTTPPNHQTTKPPNDQTYYQWAEFQNWNNNTDWVGEVQQTAWSQYHSLSITGGGEKANFRVSVGYDHQNGTIIKQTLDRFTTKLALDYFVSDRIKFSTTFPLTYTANNRNFDDNILGRAQQISPNMSVYRQNGDGTNTNEFYAMLPLGASDKRKACRPKPAR